MNSLNKIVEVVLISITFLLQPTSVSCQNLDNSQKLHLITVKSPEELRNFFRYTSGNDTFPVVCAHRGGALINYPENCIETFENTLKYTYAIMECDPRYTKDSAIVLHHDPTLQRTTNGVGKVADYTLKELKELKLKDLKGNLTDYQIPTLDEALEWAKGKTILLLDQKDVKVEARVKKVEEHNAVANVILTIYSFEDARLCYKLNKDIMMQVFIPTMEKAKEFEKTGVPWRNIVASVGHKVPVDSVLYEFIHQKGAICTAASMETIDKKYLDGEVTDFNLLKNDYSGFLTPGVDMIQTDLPAFVGSLLYGTVPDHSPKPTMPDQLKCDRCIILAEQSQHRIAVVNTTSGDIIWEWKANHSTIKPEHLKWFNAPSDAKIVYNGRYMLLSASGGGIALVRMKDKKTVFYAFAGGNTHSIELLPDGNIISASSTGNYLAIFKTDTLNYPEGIFMKKIQIPSGHNIVWDNSRQLLWTAAMDHLITFKYNFNCTNPDLTRMDSIRIPGTHAHDLFPVYKEDALWLTTADNIFKYTISSGKFQKPDCMEGRNIKSVSSGSENFPVIVVRPKEEWWTDEVFDKEGNSIFRQEGFKIYKARWLMINPFSYEENSSIHLCN